MHTSTHAHIHTHTHMHTYTHTHMHTYTHTHMHTYTHTHTHTHTHIHTSHMHTYTAGFLHVSWHQSCVIETGQLTWYSDQSEGSIHQLDRKYKPLNYLPSAVLPSSATLSLPPLQSVSETEIIFENVTMELGIVQEYIVNLPTSLQQRFPVRKSFPVIGGYPSPGYQQEYVV